MTRYIIQYGPGSFVRIRSTGGWASGYVAEAVNSYSTREKAEKAKSKYPSLDNADVIEIEKTVMIVG